MIKVNIDELNEEIVRFDNALKSFKPYTEGFINKTGDKLQGLNSDFIESLKWLLDSMTDTNAPKVLEKAQSLHDATKQTINCYEKLEKEIAKKINTVK